MEESENSWLLAMNAKEMVLIRNFLKKASPSPQVGKHSVLNILGIENNSIFNIPGLGNSFGNKKGDLNIKVHVLNNVSSYNDRLNPMINLHDLVTTSIQ